MILITGAVASSNENSMEIYEKIVELCQTKTDDILSPLDTMKFTGSNEERYQRAMDLLKKTSLIIAEMSVPSTGQGMELQEAVNLGIPIIIVAKSESKISGLILGTNKIQNVIYYDDIEMLINKLEEELNSYENNY